VLEAFWRRRREGTNRLFRHWGKISFSRAIHLKRKGGGKGGITFRLLVGGGGGRNREEYGNVSPHRRKGPIPAGIKKELGKVRTPPPSERRRRGERRKKKPEP